MRRSVFFIASLVTAAIGVAIIALYCVSLDGRVQLGSTVIEVSFADPRALALANNAILIAVGLLIVSSILLSIGVRSR